MNQHEFDDLIEKERKFVEQEPDKKYINAEYTSNIKIEGVGKDAEVVTNDKGGKQSKTPMALHLVDPKFLQAWCNDSAFTHPDNIYHAIASIACFMEDQDLRYLDCAMNLIEGNRLQQLIRIAKVLQYGADRYEANNWRLIPQESHINHALIHLVAHLMGDTQDDHLDHALCRLMMAYATEKSEGFDYNKCIPTIGTIVETATSHPDFKPIVKCSYKYDCHYKEDNK